MSAAETIAKAIEKLEAHKEESRSKGPWWVQKRSEALGGYWIRGLGDEVVGEMFWKSDAHLIPTLHRTIDAQLAILRHALARAESKVRTGGIPRVVWSNERDAQALAEAIIGGDR